jgi:hypothetical protein
VKLPTIVARGTQDCGRAGLNPFALQLVAESFADDPDKFADNDVLAAIRAHNGQEVWILLTKTMPKPGDFTDFTSQVANNPTDSFKAGYSAALDGPNEENAHFRWFTIPMSAAEWQAGYERGKAEGARKSEGAATPGRHETTKVSEK